MFPVFFKKINNLEVRKETFKCVAVTFGVSSYPPNVFGRPKRKKLQNNKTEKSEDDVFFPKRKYTVYILINVICSKIKTFVKALPLSHITGI